MDDERGITAIVLAGGLGTRLRHTVPDRPKALAQVAGRPFLTYLLDQLAGAGLTRVILCTGHLAGQIEEALGTSYRSLEIRYSREQTPLGTAGALLRAMHLVTTDTVLVLNGDSYTEADLVDFCAWCRTHEHHAALVTTRVPDTTRFGQLTFDRHSVVTRFEEKCISQPGWINAGIYFFASDLIRARFQSRSEGTSSLERDLLPALVGTILRAWTTTGRFIDIGTADSYAAADSFFDSLEPRPAAHASPGARESGTPDRVGLLILDRDGTLIPDKHYLCTPEEVELLPGVPEGLRHLQENGYDLAIVTNQSGIGRGYFDERDLHAVNARLLELLADDGIRISGIWHCPHTPDDLCSCRKPATGLFDTVTRELGYAAHECTVIGDKDCDVDLGRNAGARTVLVRTGGGRETEARGHCSPDLVVDGIGDLAKIETIP